MALSSSTIWETQSVGNDANGGGFVSGLGGTDFSQQAAAQFSGTDLASTNGTSAGASVTSASHSFVSSDVGNIIQISAGTSWTTGFYQIVSVSGGAATLDRACGSSATLSGGTWKEGGALASPGMAAAPAIAGNLIYVKNGSYSLTSASTNISGGCPSLAAGSGGRFVTMQGYNASRGDYGSPPTFTASGISSAILVTLATQAVLQNVILDGASLTSIAGVKGSGNVDCFAYLVTAKNCKNGGIISRSSALCRATGCATVAAIGSPFSFYDLADANTVTGFSNAGVYSGACVNIGCMAVNNSGASSHGLVFPSTPGVLIDRFLAYGNGGDGVQGNGGGGAIANIFNSLCYGNAAKGFNDNGSPQGTVNLFNCAGGSNTSGNNNFPSGNVFNFVTLTGNPFVNSGATISSIADALAAFALNATAGAGAACRAAGYPAYLDIGAIQHQDSGGGGLFTNSFSGGML